MLSIQGLTTTFKNDDEVIIAVDNVSFTINKGETVGIVGESGSGKSVTSLSIMRLLSANGEISSGEIIFELADGKKVDLLKLPEKEMRKYRGSKIAMVFQEPMTSLNPVLRCGDQVAEALILHKKLTKAQAKERTLELFNKVRLPRPEDMFDAYPHQLSGGQKQRIMIAMAMSCDPELLIADEPTTALDVTVQARILELMKELQTEMNSAMIFITHDLGVIANIANKIVVMYKGKIVEQGPVSEIFSNPKHPYTKGLLACRPPLDKRLKQLPVIRDFMTEETDGSFTEIKKSVDELVNSVIISEEERTREHKILYSKQPVLSVKNISVHYPIRSGVFSRVSGVVKAVDDISFDVYPGETMGLVGESGCGKTTLGRAIIRLIEPTKGEVIFKNKNFDSLRGMELRKMRKHIQIIFQDPYSSLNPRMTIGDAIFEPMLVHSMHESNIGRKSEVNKLLDRVGLKPEHYNRYPHEFSGGQRQRVCIARALALEPEFIICDESVSALDVSVQAQVLNLLNELKRERNLTYIFISHDLSVVKFMSDRMIVMNKGKIEEMGDPDMIYKNPASAYTKNLIDSIPTIEQYLQKI